MRVETWEETCYAVEMDMSAMDDTALAKAEAAAAHVRADVANARLQYHEERAGGGR